ncbi:GNAT family N-acetyltransferase [Nemorincola caseinilytica]|uniref:GNAT family N-acetyltransferase n=1 Tax=Nemorincola caseinilytica TaxID=2054315 RepID=A0ABP8NLG9_9BACT
MQPYTIRPIRQNDNIAIATIIRSVLTEFGANKPGTVYYDPTTDDLFSLFSMPGAEYHILEVDGQIAGGAGIYPTPGLPNGCCELVKLYILPTVRGKGLGKVLIEDCFAIARRLGYTQVYLETMPELKMAVGLYEKCGFRYLTCSLGNSGHFGCDLWMLKEL